MAVFPRLLALVALASPFVAYADTEKVKLSLSATGHARGTPSIMTATFSLQDTAEKPAEAQTRLNAMADKTSQTIKNAPHVKASFRNYDTWQNEKKDGSITWGARQKLVLTSSDSKQLLDLTGRLQKDGLPLDALSWSIDPETRKKLEQEAQADALNTIKKDAAHIANTIGMHVGMFHEINVSGRYQPFTGVTMLRAATANAPQRSDDDAQDISVQISAEIYLVP